MIDGLFARLSVLVRTCRAEPEALLADWLKIAIAGLGVC